MTGRPLEAANDGSGMDDGWRGIKRKIEFSEDVAGPVASFEVDESGVGGMGVLRDAPCAEPVEDKLGHHDPVGSGIDVGGRVCQQLVNGVDAQRR